MDSGEGAGPDVAHLRVGGVRVACAGQEDLLSLMERDASTERRPLRPRLVFDTNGQGLSLAARDPAYAAALERADIVHADGTFIVWASRLKRGGRVPERTATTDLLPAAAARAERAGLSFYLLGGTAEVNAAARTVLSARHPALRIAGRDGYFDPDALPRIARDIRAFGADVVWLGMGKPREQAMACRLADLMDGPGAPAWIATCGGCFHFLSGDYERAPRWMQAAGLEWLHRAATGPAYLRGRYAATVPHALGLVLWRDVLGRGGSGA